jgi:hypothetical protein
MTIALIKYKSVSIMISLFLLALIYIVIIASTVRPYAAEMKQDAEEETGKRNDLVTILVSMAGVICCIFLGWQLKCTQNVTGWSLSSIFSVRFLFAFLLLGIHCVIIYRRVMHFKEVFGKDSITLPTGEAFIWVLLSFGLGLIFFIFSKSLCAKTAKYY